MKIMIRVEDKLNKFQKTPSSLDNYYLECGARDKLSWLADFLLTHPNEKVIVFFLTCACVDYFWKVFTKMDSIQSRLLSIHGKAPTKKRHATLDKFGATSASILFTTDLAARGLDFADNPVDWIIQFDAPQHPDYFVHRVGRTARMGSSGQAVLLLMPNELTYVDFLKIREVPIAPYPKQDELPHVPDIVPTVKGYLRNEREIFQKSQIAFVSWVRAYKEHHCSYIFNLKEVDLPNLMNSFALLRIPIMPELKNIKIEYAEEETGNIQYANKTKEKERIEKQNNYEKKKLEKAEKKQDKRAKWEQGEEMKRKREEENAMTDDDVAELFREARLLKRRKKGKLTEEQFEKMTGEVPFDDDSNHSENETEDWHMESEGQSGDGFNKKKKKKNRNNSPAGGDESASKTGNDNGVRVKKRWKREPHQKPVHPNNTSEVNHSAQSEPASKVETAKLQLTPNNNKKTSSNSNSSPITNPKSNAVPLGGSKKSNHSESKTKIARKPRK